MKTIYRSTILILLISGVLSCNKGFLDESPDSFLTTETAYNTEADFTASVNNLYGLVRAHYYTINDFIPFFYMYRTDGFFEITVTTPNMAGDVSPTGMTNFAWEPNYKIIAEANTIISRLPAATQVADDKKKLFEAKARFFRAFAYRALAYLYGGVPLNLEEVVDGKTDFVRAGRHDVYAQAIEDLKFAAANLPAIGAVLDGEISNLVAQHVLAEVYIADGQYQNAVTAASVVIDDPNTDLMTTRFGSRSTVTPGDVYWDLFQVKNQNRKSAGNKEALWVVQLETDVPGGGASTTGGAQSGVYAMERCHAPLFRDVKINGVAPFRWPIGDYTGGRGVGFLSPSPYFITNIWQSDFNNDIRNANHNFIREFTATNPASPFFGQTISTINPPAGLTGISGAVTANKPDRAIYPYQSKATTPFNHPSSIYEFPNSTDPILKYQVKSGAGGTYCDQYIYRLAETYLLRAEAYLGLNKKTEAAADINVVRTRASASAVLPANVTIDYILDERLRELGVEERRMLTLMRLGKWVERVRNCNSFYGVQMKDHYNLWPIPSAEIERNRSADIPQNPGY